MACFSVECKAMIFLSGKVGIIYIKNKKQIY